MFSKPQFTEKEIDDLQIAYEEAVYEVYYKGETIRLFVNQHNPNLDFLLKKYNCATWAVITAFNPYSQCLSTAENQQRHQSLIEYLEPLNLNILDAVGKDKNGVWTPETSIFIMGIKLESAIALGKKFQQNAIVFGRLGILGKLLWL